MTPEKRLVHRQQYARPPWDELHAWMKQPLAGERAAVVMSLLQSTKLNGQEPVLTRLPTQLNSRLEELLPHR